MDLSINFNNNNSYKLSFNARLTKFSKENMDKILLPLLQDDTIEFKDMVTRSGYTSSAVLNWFKNTMGVSATEYFKNRTNDKLKKEFELLYKQGLSTSEIANHYGYSEKWVYKNFKKFGLKSRFAELEDKLNDRVPGLIQEGFSIVTICKILKCSKTRLQNWLNKNLKEGIVKYRHDNNIIQKRKGKDVDKEKELLENYFSCGMTIADVSKLLGYPTSKVLALKNKYGIKSSFNLAHERMEELVPRMLEEKLSLRKMSLAVGLSAATIRRWIIKTYGGYKVN